MGTVMQLTLTVIIPCLLIGFRVTGSHDRTIRIWSTATWECEGVLEGHEGENVSNMAENVAFRFFFSVSRDQCRVVVPVSLVH